MKYTLGHGAPRGPFDLFAQDNDLLGMEITDTERDRLNQRRYFVILPMRNAHRSMFDAINWCLENQFDVTMGGVIGPDIEGEGPGHEVTVLGFDDLSQATECKLTFT